MHKRVCWFSGFRGCDASPYPTCQNSENGVVLTPPHVTLVTSKATRLFWNSSESITIALWSVFASGGLLLFVWCGEVWGRSLIFAWNRVFLRVDELCVCCLYWNRIHNLELIWKLLILLYKLMIELFETLMCSAKHYKRQKNAKRYDGKLR